MRAKGGAEGGGGEELCGARAHLNLNLNLELPTAPSTFGHVLSH
jgi:hypothetical protein